MNKTIRWAVCVLVLSIVAVVPGCRPQADHGREGEGPSGQALYERHCAVCHGPTGDGRGKAAYLLMPKPRNFRKGKFRLVSTQNLAPDREDLLRTITEGMPGTAMPPWEHLSEGERRALADYVLRLSWEGWRDIGLALGDSREKAESYATEMTKPGDPFPVPPDPPVTAEGLEQGKAYYLKVCAKCHGADGKGKRDPTWKTAEGFPTWSRDLAGGVFKGGREGRQLYLRFAAGMPGTPMPSGELTGAQVWRVVQYVQSLSDPEAQNRARIQTQEVTVKRVSSLPPDPDDASWLTLPVSRVPLMPLWWREGYVGAVRVRGAHDGSRLALLLEWEDATRDSQATRQRVFPDAAAAQFTSDGSPPLFAMGADDRPVNIWHWKSVWEEDRAGFQDVGTAFPRLVSDAHYDSQDGWRSSPSGDRSFRPAAELMNPVALRERPGVVEDANAAGVGTLTSQATERQDVQGASRWQDGVWRVQLVRSMGSSGAEDIRLNPGNSISVAFAIWDGSAGDRDGQKTVSIWNPLRVDE